MRSTSAVPAVWIATLLLVSASLGCGRAMAPNGATAGRSPSAAAILAPTDDGTLDPTAPGASKQDAPPVVRIVDPVPTPLFTHNFPFGQPVTIRWAATDADGPGPGVRSYRYLLIGEDDPDFILSLANPDSLRSRDAPGFANWTEVKGSVDQATYTDLQPNSRYVFVVTAFDRKHEYDPVFSLGKNMLLFRYAAAATPAATAGEPASGPGAQDSDGGSTRHH